jgi:phosphatidylethanolamine-binding protein (PEBP) family uncharacterized protein
MKDLLFRIPLLFALLSAIALFANRSLGADPAPSDKFTLASSAFIDGGTLPVDYTCDGGRASPPVEWKNAPKGTQSFAITMHHIPGPGEKHVYMVIYNIPADVQSISKNSKDVGVWGINTVNGQQEYTPPCSKGPGPKKYTMTVYALSAEPKFDKSAADVTMDDLLSAIKGTTLATSAINVTYSRQGNTNEDQQNGGGQNADQPNKDQPGGNQQGGNADRPRRTPPEQQAVNDLQLSGDEKTKVDSILQDYRDKQQKLRDDLLAQMKLVLNDDQYKKFEAAFRRPPRPAGQGGNAAGTN